MCGRYGRRADKQRIAAAMQAGYSNVFDEIPPSFNVAPQTSQPVVRLSRDSGEREIALMVGLDSVVGERRQNRFQHDQR
jgi:putative SOS response-associated peptidase YedK